MNLYVIKFEHYSQKDSKIGIVTYVVAENDAQVYEWIKSEPKGEDWVIFNSWKYYEEDGTEYELYDGDIKCIGEESFKDHIIRVCGQMYSEHSSYDDLYYGKSYFGWDIIKENIQEHQIDVLMETIGLVVLDKN